ncbi:thiolase family protein [Vulcanisaeta souniana]|uniref:Acetyl-CoA acetyltransferase n=1 Tax=Vulcanisaeta souniana JCM 11219 TaxID=1293586 RepID=A0A830EFQ7_9CREN|nr:thiolase family protein [Vulcanisaeta souniana]BDR91334.1 acetyl-CoA acetyltransferase [Vulcanisaeta souniana JCM 11219]GGI72422.1 acetyl-CoA acetyltransferase [Vulcanisaeta souniana JCM 11219]
MSQEVVITGFVRTPIGKFGGAFRNMKTPYLAAETIKSLINRVGIDGKLIDEVVFGSTLQGGMGQNLSRFAALLAGLPNSVSAFTVNRVCSSGMQAIIEAVRALKVGDVNVVIAGGAESMSTQPLALPHDARWGIKHLIGRDLRFMDLMIHDGLIDPTNMMLMGQEADKVAVEHEITREELDKVAYESHMRALRATENKYYLELEPVDTAINGERVYLDKDEGIRPDTSLEKLARLKPAFGSSGLHTAGNSSQLSDGAAALLLTTIDKAKELGLRPMARIIGYTWHMLEPWRFPEAPIHAIRKLLSKVGWDVGDVDVFEVNEAFAVVNVLVNKELGIPYEKMNIFGGAIALGHPLGASGARIVTTLMSALIHVGGRRGVAALCHGTGGATAVAVEML